MLPKIYWFCRNFFFNLINQFISLFSLKIRWRLPLNPFCPHPLFNFFLLLDLIFFVSPRCCALSKNVNVRFKSTGQSKKIHYVFQEKFTFLIFLSCVGMISLSNPLFLFFRSFLFVDLTPRMLMHATLTQLLQSLIMKFRMQSFKMPFNYWPKLQLTRTINYWYDN